MKTILTVLIVPILLGSMIYSSILRATPILQKELPKELISFDIMTQDKVIIPTRFENKKALVLVFMSAQCPCSNSHVGEIKSLQKKFQEMDFYVIHSNVNEALETSKKYFASLDMPVKILQDKEAHLADLMQAYKTPHAFIISPKGEILYKGGVTNSSTAEKADKHFLAEALDDIQNRRAVKNPEAKALGCFISREKED